MEVMCTAYVRYFYMELENEIKREMCPYEMEKDLSKQLGGQP